MTDKEHYAHTDKKPQSLINAPSPKEVERINKYIGYPKAVLFDLDDTLISSRPLYMHVKDIMLADLDKDGWGEDFEEDLRGKPIHYYVTERLTRATNDDGSRTFSDEQIKPMVEEYFDRFNTRLVDEAHRQLRGRTDGEEIMHALEGARETLSMFQKADIPIAIITNSPQTLVDFSIPDLFPDLFNRQCNKPIIVGSARSDHQGKAGDRMILKALKELHIRPDEVDKNVYYVGDTISDDLSLAWENDMTGILFGKGDLSQHTKAMDSEEQTPPAIHHSHTAQDHKALQKLFEPLIEARKRATEMLQYN